MFYSGGCLMWSLLLLSFDKCHIIDKVDNQFTYKDNLSIVIIWYTSLVPLCLKVITLIRFNGICNCKNNNKAILNILVMKGVDPECVAVAEPCHEVLVVKG